MTDVANPFDDAETVSAFADDHYGLVRGRVRTALIDRQLAMHLPELGDAPLRIVDVGGGSGQQSIPLAERGHHVTIVDPSASMLERARRQLDARPVEVAQRVALVEAPVGSAIELLGPGRFDLVLCHGVLLYVPAPPTLAALVQLAVPGGLVSVVSCNRRSLALRPGLAGDWSEALRCFDDPGYRNELGIDARADDPDEIGDRLAGLGAEPVAWYGVRLFTDPLRSDADLLSDPEAFDQILDVEWEAATRDPYRQLCRLFHLVARSMAEVRYISSTMAR